MLINRLQPVSLVLLAVTPTILQVGQECSYWFQTFVFVPAEREQSADGFSWLGLWEVICGGNKWGIFKGSINVVKWVFLIPGMKLLFECKSLFMWLERGREEEGLALGKLRNIMIERRNHKMEKGERISEQEIQEQLFPSTHAHIYSRILLSGIILTEGAFHITGWLLLQRDAF